MKTITRLLITCIITVVFASGLVFLYLKMRATNSDVEQNLYNTLTSFTLVDNRINTDLTIVRNSLFNNGSEGLIKSFGELEERFQFIQNAVASFPVYEKNTELVKKSMNAKLQLIKELVEESKGIQVAYNEMTDSYEKFLSTDKNALSNESIELINEIRSLLLVYYFSNNIELESLLKNKLKQLENHRVSMPKHSKVDIQLEDLQTRINYIIKKRDTIISIFGQLDEIRLSQYVDEFQKEVSSNLRLKISQGEEIRTLFAYYAFGLLFLIILMEVRLLFNYITTTKFNDYLKGLNQTLEESVKKRTKELSTALEKLSNSEAELIQAEKMASLGQLVAGVAHEINTPLAYAKSSLETIEINLTTSNLMEYVEASEVVVEVLGKDRNTLTDEEKIKFKEALGVSKSLLSDFKQNGISFKDIVSEMVTLIQDGNYGVDQIAELVGNLRSFSRLDKSKISNYKLSDAINSSLILLKHEMKTKNMNIHIEDDVSIQCSPSQINQVIINLLTNANYAIDPEKGKIDITVRKAGDEFVDLIIEDNGFGIPEENLSQIFDPFFTTKPVGKGTGLGLSIIYKIIQEHHGDIFAESVVNKGTKFTVKLPYKQVRLIDQTVVS